MSLELFEHSALLRSFNGSRERVKIKYSQSNHLTLKKKVLKDGKNI